jgi:hypothetical protein
MMWRSQTRMLKEGNMGEATAKSIYSLVAAMLLTRSTLPPLMEVIAVPPD